MKFRKIKTSGMNTVRECNVPLFSSKVNSLRARSRFSGELILFSCGHKYFVKSLGNTWQWRLLQNSSNIDENVEISLHGTKLCTLLTVWHGAVFPPMCNINVPFAPINLNAGGRSLERLSLTVAGTYPYHPITFSQSKERRRLWANYLRGVRLKAVTNPRNGIRSLGCATLPQASYAKHSEKYACSEHCLLE